MPPHKLGHPTLKRQRLGLRTAHSPGSTKKSLTLTSYSSVFLRSKTNSVNKNLTIRSVIIIMSVWYRGGASFFLCDVGSERASGPHLAVSGARSCRPLGPAEREQFRDEASVLLSLRCGQKGLRGTCAAPSGMQGGGAAHRMVNIEEAFAGRQLVRLLDLLQASDGQEHADGRTQGEEIHRLKVQGVVDHRHLQDTHIPTAVAQV